MSLTLQLNIAEQKAAQFEKDNEGLIARWMELKRQEADAMNEASEF